MLESFGLDPGILHLNHGAFGVAPVYIGGTGYLRIAAAPYNTPDDYDRLADTVRDLLKRW
jgi:selenocysteine lyase/cysteine desulfurase